jgi:hypothetical protein
MPKENMRGRRVEEKAESTDQANKAKTARLFVRLPRELATHPPIQHRGKHDVGKAATSEFVIAVAIAALAYIKVEAQQHEHSFRAGGKAMDDSDYPGKYKSDVGFNGYHRTRQRFEAPETVTITVSARQLFRAAGISRAGNLALLPATLHRLREQRVGRLLPLLRSFSKASTGRWTLEVDGRWTALKRYVQVPWPPPTGQGGLRP